jgi:succinoglycan biosynthesis protein ExoM
MQIKKSEITHIIIAVCTYKRKQELERCLISLCDMNYPENIKTEILVIDNDIEKSANEIYKNFKNRLNIHYTTETAQGLSNVRNKALKEAIGLGGTHLAFIDDDEVADENWLINHVNFYNKFEEIYISSGPTYKKFDRDYPDYIVNNKVFRVISRKELGAYKKTCASGNVFFPLNIIQENNIYFDEKFNFSGSEDTDFFGRLNKAGYKIGWNYNAVNFEIVTSERANIKWILKRAFHNGYSVSMTKFTNQEYSFKRIFYILEKFFTLLIDFLTIIFSIPFGMTKLLNSVVRFTKNSGKFCRAIY